MFLAEHLLTFEEWKQQVKEQREDSLTEENLKMEYEEYVKSFNNQGNE